MTVAEKIKNVILVGLALFLGWYSQQAANNPWKMRSSFYFNDNAVIFYEKNHNTRSEDYIISIPVDTMMKTIDDFYIYGWKIQNREWGLSAKAGNVLIIIPFEDIELAKKQNITSDVLVVFGDSANVAEKRKVFRPKITIWYAEEKGEFPARNVHIPRTDEKFRLRRNRDGFRVEVIE